MEITHLDRTLETETIACTHCDAVGATHFLETDAEEDPSCDACYDRLYGHCARCRRLVRLDDLADVRVLRQTRLDPAEYESWCSGCSDPRDDGPDGDRDDD